VCVLASARLCPHVRLVAHRSSAVQRPTRERDVPIPQVSRPMQPVGCAHRGWSACSDCDQAAPKRVGLDESTQTGVLSIPLIIRRSADPIRHQPSMSRSGLDRTALVSLFLPFPTSRVTRTRAYRLATSANRLAAATPSPPPASFRRPTPMGVPLLSVAAGAPRLGNRQTGDGSEMASQGLSDLLAVATTLSPDGPRRAPKSGPRSVG
jgi:hypothetical protein